MLRHVPQMNDRDVQKCSDSMRHFSHRLTSKEVNLTTPAAKSSRRMLLARRHANGKAQEFPPTFRHHDFGANRVLREKFRLLH